MSSTMLYGVHKNGDVKIYGEARNAWLGAMHVWNSLKEKYQIIEDSPFNFENTWNKLGTGIYKKFENIVLASTYDYVLVKKEEIETLKRAFAEFEENYPGSNLVSQIEILNKIESDEDIIGVGWCQTSVAGDMWDYDYDEEAEEVIPYNIYKGGAHWFLFGELADEH